MGVLRTGGPRRVLKKKRVYRMPVCRWTDGARKACRWMDVRLKRAGRWMVAAKMVCRWMRVFHPMGGVRKVCLREDDRRWRVFRLRGGRRWPAGGRRAPNVLGRRSPDPAAEPPSGRLRSKVPAGRGRAPPAPPGPDGRGRKLGGLPPPSVRGRKLGGLPAPSARRKLGGLPAPSVRGRKLFLSSSHGFTNDGRDGRSPPAALVPSRRGANLPPPGLENGRDGRSGLGRSYANDQRRDGCRLPGVRVRSSASFE